MTPKVRQMSHIAVFCMCSCWLLTPSRLHVSLRAGRSELTALTADDTRVMHELAASLEAPQRVCGASARACCICLQELQKRCPEINHESY